MKLAFSDCVTLPSDTEEDSASMVVERRFFISCLTVCLVVAATFVGLQRARLGRPCDELLERLNGAGAKWCITSKVCGYDCKEYQSMSGFKSCVRCGPNNYTACKQRNDEAYSCDETYSNTSPAYCDTLMEGTWNGATFCNGRCTTQTQNSCGELIPNSTSGNLCPPI